MSTPKDPAKPEHNIPTTEPEAADQGAQAGQQPSESTPAPGAGSVAAPEGAKTPPTDRHAGQDSVASAQAGAPDDASEGGEKAHPDPVAPSDAGSPPGNGSQPPEKTVRPVRTGGLWLVILLLGLGVMALAAGEWLLWQSYQQDRVALKAFSSLRTELDSERQRILDEARIRLEETLKLTEARQKAAEERLQRQISQLAQNVLRQSATSRTDWLLAEAEYLLRLANQRLALEQDVKGALKALETADAVLAEADDPALVPVRKALAEERAALRATGLPDRTGLFLKLEALAAQVDRLNQNVFIAPVETHTSAGDQDVSQTEAADWNGRLARLQKQIEKYLVIRRLDTPVEPLLSPDQIAYLKANLRLMLEQAQLAVLQRDARVYTASLDKARQWLRRWLVGQDATTSALLESLQALRNEAIAPELPDISGSLRLLKGVMRQLENEEGGA